MERQITKMGGNVITLEGREVSVGEKAPDFIVLDNDLLPKYLKDFAGRIKLISAVPSLDTSVCDTETRKFNELTAGFSKDVVVLTISMDLPFAQKRWCSAAGVDRVITLSDYKEASFGLSYGVLIKELRLLNRSIFIVDKDDVIRYIEIVEENYNHPDYNRAVKALKSM
ncbi:MAG: thiol peroxidase [Spirochaetes bacterium]|nr:MAG: thiol peroxidase [Spirochaetota bacterium]